MLILNELRFDDTPYCSSLHMCVNSEVTTAWHALNESSTCNIAELQCKGTVVAMIGQGGGAVEGLERGACCGCLLRVSPEG